MFKTSFYKLCLFTFSVLLLAGCASLQDPAKDSEYSAIELQEKAALELTSKLFNRMEAIDAALYLNKEDFSSLVNKTFAHFYEHFTQLDAPGFSNVTFGRMQLELSKQKISSRINFSFEVDALKRTIFGHLSAEHSIKAGTNSFVLGTNFNEIILDRIDGNESLEENSENRDLIAASVKNFMHILNIEIINMPLKISVDMNVLNNINGKDIVSSTDYKLHSARAVNMQTKMDIYLPYVWERGVVLLGAGELRAARDEKPIEDLLALRENLKTKIDQSLYKNMGISLETLKKYSSFYISKTYLSKQMNLALKKMDLRVINKFFLKIPDEESHLQKDIYFFDKEQLPSCDGVRVECSNLLKSCERQCGLKFGIHRCVQCDDMTNPFEQVRCMSDLQACKAKEELHVYECNKRENRCDIQNNEIQTSCEIKNLDYVAQCKEKKEKLLFINDEIMLTQLRLDLDIVNAYAVQRIKQITFDKSLNSLEVIRDMHISVDSKMQFDLNKSPSDDINCSLQMQEALLTHSEFDYVAQKRKLPLLTQRGERGRMLIKAISKPTFISSSLKNRPYDKLTKDKDFNLQCSYQGMPMKTIKADKLLAEKDIPYALNIILGEIELQFEEEELSFAVSPVRLGSDILLYPTMEAQAIGFSRQAHFY